MASALTLATIPAASFAQVCGSTGADGALVLSGAGTVDFDPVALGLNPAGDNVFHFTSIQISQNSYLRLRASKMRSQRPVIFLSSGPVAIDGSIELSGANGHTGTDQFAMRSPSEPGPGGYPGGAGGRPGELGQSGAGPGGAGPGVATANGLPHGCPAAFAGQPSLVTTSLASRFDPAHCPTPTASYGNPSLQPLVGGSGGSGGKVPAGGSYTGGGGGAGGGAIRICSETSITLTRYSQLQPPSLTANGGNGGAGSPYGGPGSGGSIHLQAPVVTINGLSSSTPSMTALGGGYDNGYDTGSSGRIRIDSSNVVNTGPVVPSPALGPFVAALRPPSPTVKILSVNGLNMKAYPTNSAAVPDLTLNAAGPVPIVVQTANIPNGATARFVISSDAGGVDIVQNAVVSNNSATLNAVLPPGLGHLFVRVSF